MKESRGEVKRQPKEKGKKAEQNDLRAPREQGKEVKGGGFRVK